MYIIFSSTLPFVIVSHVAMKTERPPEFSVEFVEFDEDGGLRHVELEGATHEATVLERVVRHRHAQRSVTAVSVTVLHSSQRHRAAQQSAPPGSTAVSATVQHSSQRHW